MTIFGLPRNPDNIYTMILLQRCILRSGRRKLLNKSWLWYRLGSTVTGLIREADQVGRIRASLFRSPGGPKKGHVKGVEGVFGLPR